MEKEDLPTQLIEMDRLKLENFQLKMLQAQHFFTTAKDNYEAFIGSLLSGYKINPTKDTVDKETGVITRG